MGDVTRQPKPIELDLNGNIEEISLVQSVEETNSGMAGVGVNDSYKNPFARIDPFAKSSSVAAVTANNR